MVQTCSIPIFVALAVSGFSLTACQAPGGGGSSAGLPSNRLGLVSDHAPVKCSGHVLYFINGQFAGIDRFTKTYSIVPWKQGESEHAFKFQKDEITAYSSAGMPGIPDRDRWRQTLENSLRYETFHQEADRSLVLDAVIGVDGTPREIDHEVEHYIYPGTLEIGTTWLSEPITSSLPGSHKFEVIGSEIYEGTNCWVISSTRQAGANSGVPNSETVRHAARFLLDPLTLSVLRIDAITEGVGPLGSDFRFVYHLDIEK